MTTDSTALPSEEPSVIRALGILRRRAGLATLVFITVIASVIAFAGNLPDLFRAKAAVLIARPIQDVYVQSAASDELDSRLQIIKQEVLSRARLTELIQRFNLYPELRAQGDTDAALEEMRRDIQVEMTGAEQVNGRARTVAFNLSFTGNSPKTVADVTNAIASFYVDQNSQMRAQDAERTTRFLKAQLDEARAQLEGGERQIRAYTTRYGGALPQQVDVNLATLERMNTQLRLNIEQQMRVQDQREKLLEHGPVSAGLTTPRIARLEELRLELAQFETYSDKHPDVRRIKSEIASLEATATPTAPATGPGGTSGVAAAAPRARTIQNIEADTAALQAEERALRQSIATMERRLDGVPQRQNEFTSISRGNETNRAQFESLVKRYEEARLAESMERTNQGERFRILESAAPPTTPLAPRRVNVLLAGLLLALLAAGLAVLLAERADTSFHTVEDLRQFTRVPVLATVPRLVPAQRRLVNATAVTVLFVAATALAGAAAAYVAHGNEPLVRLLARV